MRYFILSTLGLFGTVEVAAQEISDSNFSRTADGKEWLEPDFTEAAIPSENGAPSESAPASDDSNGNAATQTQNIALRIVRGETAYIADAAWQAQIFAKGPASFADDDPDLLKDKENWERGLKTNFLWAKPRWERDHRCGGALIRSDWIVTAAHCADMQGGNIFKVRGVRLGTLNLPQGTEYRIERVVIHGDYQRTASGAPIHDIALMRIVPERGSPRPEFRPKSIRIVGSKDSDLDVFDNRAVVATGWGLTRARSSSGQLALDGKTLNRMSPRLMKVSLTIKDHSACAAEPRYKDALIAEILCAGSSDGRDTCSGDSGGPLTRAEGPERVLVGLVSYGRGCGLKGTQSLYVNMSRYRGWIDRAIGQARAGTVKYVK